MVSGANKDLNRELWTAARFNASHGREQAGGALVNCETGSIVPNSHLSDFFKGFESIKARMKDDQGKRMILKLKDWPTAEDFIDKMPEHFKVNHPSLPNRCTPKPVSV